MKKLFLFLSLLLLPLLASADESGSCGDGVTYFVEEATGTLTVSKSGEGTGKMTDYSLVVRVPWYSYRDKILKVVIEDDVTSIGGSAFEGCSGLTSVIIPNSVTSIESFAFRGCSGLTSITIPNSVTSIDAPLFLGCSGLTSIVVDGANSKYDSRNNCNAIIETSTNKLITGCKNTVIPDDVTSIGYAAFYGCSGLTSITIPNSVFSIGAKTFAFCSDLTSIVVDGANSIYDSRNNCNAIIETSTNELIAGCKNTVISDDVTSIGYNAFGGCSGLTSIDIPNSVTSIGGSAFEGCSGLTSIDVPNSVTSIGHYAFRGCSDLTSVTIGNSVTSIGHAAFEGCSGLTSVTIGNSVTSIGIFAFEGCSGLTSVLVEAVTPPSMYDNSFKYYDIPLFVPEESIGLYQSTSPWSNFTDIRAIEQCTKPTITLKDGKLSFSSETEGATFIYSLSTPAAANGEGQTVALSTTYAITVYAKKEGMKNSETVTMEFDVRGLKGDVNEDGSVDAVDITKLVEIVIGKADGEPEISTDDIGTGDAGEAVRREQ